MPEKVGALTPLGVKSGKYNGTPNFWGGGGVKSGHFPSHFYYTTSIAGTHSIRLEIGMILQNTEKDYQNLIIINLS